jgi:hypothetical protein
MTDNTTIIMTNSSTKHTTIEVPTPEGCDDPRIRNRAGGFRE